MTNGIAVPRTPSRIRVLTDVNAATSINYGSGLITFPAPLLAAGPAVTQHAALSSALRIGDPDPGATPLVALREVTFDSAMGAQLPAGVDDSLRVDDTLAWVVVYPHSTPVPRGPPGLSSSARAAIVASESCIWVVVIDASTGSGIDNEQICTPKAAG